MVVYVGCGCICSDIEARREVMVVLRWSLLTVIVSDIRMAVAVREVCLN
jgi:hypothetical protein